MNPFIRYDQRLEDFVRNYVKSNFPVVNQTGIISGAIFSSGQAPLIANNRENGSSGGVEFFVWGTTLWGSKTHVIAQ